MMGRGPWPLSPDFEEVLPPTLPLFCGDVWSLCCYFFNASSGRLIFLVSFGTIYDKNWIRISIDEDLIFCYCMVCDI